MAVKTSTLKAMTIAIVLFVLASSGLFVPPAAVQANATAAGVVLDEAVGVPILIAPKGTIYVRTPTYQWSRVKGASEYWIQVKQSGIGNPFIDKKNLDTRSYCNANTCSVTFPAALGYKLYKWRVKAEINTYWKQWSAWEPFVVAPSAGGFYSYFTNNANGWVVHNGSWLLQNNTYYTTTGKKNQAATISHTGNYSTLTYEVKMKRTGCRSCVNVVIIRGNPGTIDEWGWWNTEYTFDYTNSGYFSVWRDDHGTQTYLTPGNGWVSHWAIKKFGWNTLKVTASGGHFHFYINGHKVWEGNDNSGEPYYSSGRVGIGMFYDANTDDKLWVDWAKLVTNVSAADENEVLVPGVAVPGGSHNESP